MKQPLYCIEHEEVVLPEYVQAIGAEIHPVIIPELDENGYPCGTSIDFCEFDGGWASCPPPEYDLDGYIETHGQPPSITSDIEDVEEVFPIWTFDLHTEQMVIEERVQ